MAKRKHNDTWGERWCLVALRGLHSDALEKQCEHADAPGRYVVKSEGDWCGFDPPTKLQALSWANNKPEREARIMWLCGECGEVMPLSSYSAEAEKIRNSK